MSSININQYRPRHWIILVALGCIALEFASSEVLDSSYGLEHPNVEAIVAGDEVVTIMPNIDAAERSVRISIIIMMIAIGSIVVYAVQWIVTIIGLWIPPRA